MCAPNMARFLMGESPRYTLIVGGARSMARESIVERTSSSILAKNILAG